MILHKEHTSNYTVIDNALLCDPSLSAKAKGVLCYLLSKPEGWNVVMADMVKHFTDGASSIRSALKELYKTGYASLEHPREHGRLLGSIIRVSEEPRFKKREFQKNTH